MAAAALGLNGALNLTRNNRSRAVAANLASQTVDVDPGAGLRHDRRGEPRRTTQPVDSIVYTIETNTEWVGPDHADQRLRRRVGREPRLPAGLDRGQLGQHGRRAAGDRTRP